VTASSEPSSKPATAFYGINCNNTTASSESSYKPCETASSKPSYDCTKRIDPRIDKPSDSLIRAVYEPFRIVSSSASLDDCNKSFIVS
jgi:hypothetical protein